MYLIEKYKVNPEEILVITFSKNATKEMKERFHALKSTNSKLVTFGTFHGIYYGILKWAYKLTSENIFSDEQKYQFLQRVVERMDLDIDDEKELFKEQGGKRIHIPAFQFKPLECSVPLDLV